MAINPNTCTRFIQIWVDVNALSPTNNGSIGIYCVDNNGQGNSTEDTATLTTTSSVNSNICWQILPLDPQYKGTMSIQNFTSSISGFNTQPQSFSQDTWTGQTGANGSTSPYSINVQFQGAGGFSSWSGVVKGTFTVR
jgi:hypothetical protein